MLRKSLLDYPASEAKTLYSKKTITKGRIFMKQTVALTSLVLISLTFSLSEATAQRRGTIVAGPAKAQKATAIKLEDISVMLGTPPKILATSGGSVSDISSVDGASSNVHTPSLGGITMNFDGFAFGASDTLYGLTSAYMTNAYKSYLFIIGPNTGNNRFETLSYGKQLTMSGNRWYCLGEGDLAYEPGGSLYATCYDGVWKLVTINPGSGSSTVANVTIRGSMPAGSAYSALAFNSAGQLYALDTVSRILWKLDKNNPSNSPIAMPLTVSAGQQMPNTSTRGGMGFSADGLYASFGGQLVIINPATGALSIVTGNNGGFVSGLAVSGGSGPIRQQ